jgi:hypothetical protein
MFSKNTFTIGLIAACTLCGPRLKAQHAWEDPNAWMGNHFAYDTKGPLYTSQEVSLDLFASYIHSEGNAGDLFETDIKHGGFWGGGAGVNYFFTPLFGLGADFNISSKPDDIDLVDQVTGNVLFRLPIGSSGVAPYLIGSGGRSLSPHDNWVYGGGLGMEFRFNPTTGIFSDGRFFWNDRSTADNRLLIRAGVRIAF